MYNRLTKYKLCTCRWSGKWDDDTFDLSSVVNDPATLVLVRVVRKYSSMVGRTSYQNLLLFYCTWPGGDHASVDVAFINVRAASRKTNARVLFSCKSL